MHIVNLHKSIIELTHLNQFGRFPDSWPRVPDDLLEGMTS